MANFNKILNNFRSPYKFKGAKGENYVVQDIGEIIGLLVSSTSRSYFYFNGEKEVETFSCRIIDNNQIKFQSIAGYGYGIAYQMVLDIASEINGGEVIERDNHGNITALMQSCNYFNITHMKYPDIFEGMPEDTIPYILYELVKGNKKRAKRYFDCDRSFGYRVDYSTVKFQRNGGGIFKRMSTFQERKFGIGHENEYGEGTVRKKRLNVPNSWDDIKKARQPNRSWKQKKVKKQWQKNLKK